MTSPQEDAELDNVLLWVIQSAKKGDEQALAYHKKHLVKYLADRDEQREREAFEKGRQVGQFQASNKLYGDVTTMFIFKDNFDPKPTKQLSQAAFDLLKDCESFMNANSKVYADYLMEITNPREQDKEEE